jgi:hypothetical protein
VLAAAQRLLRTYSGGAKGRRKRGARAAPGKEEARSSGGARGRRRSAWTGRKERTLLGSSSAGAVVPTEEIRLGMDKVGSG